MKNENKKFPIIAIVLTIIGLFVAVICASTGLFLPFDKTAGITPLALLEIVVSVLLLAGLTTGKDALTKTASIIVTIALTVISFSLVIINLSVGDYPKVIRAVLFGLSLLMLISSVLSMIYYFTAARNDRIKIMYKIMSVSFFAILFIYAVCYLIYDLSKASEPSINIYFLTFALAIISIIPMVSSSYEELEEVSRK